MDKSNLELFKQALNEAISNKFDKMAAECTEEITCSERHKLAMRTIVYGKTDTRRVWSPKMKRIVAILVAAALLLTSCGIIFRNEIREIFENFFVKLSYSESDATGAEIEEIYELTYLPEGYYLEEENVSYTAAKYKYVNSDGDHIYFEQRILNGTDFIVDSESGYSRIIEIEGLNVYVYYRYTDKYHCYICNDIKHAIRIKSNAELSDQEITLILSGLQIK